MTLNNGIVSFQQYWSFGGMLSTPSLPSLTGLLCPGVVALDMILSIDQIELNCVIMLNWIVWKRAVFDIETVDLR